MQNSRAKSFDAPNNLTCQGKNIFDDFEKCV
jgi:hypothetical protein